MWLTLHCWHGFAVAYFHDFLLLLPWSEVCCARESSLPLLLLSLLSLRRMLPPIHKVRSSLAHYRTSSLAHYRTSSLAHYRTSSLAYYCTYSLA